MSLEQTGEYRKLGYQGDEIVSQSGLEKWGETYLAGTRGGVLSAYTPGGQFFQEIARKDSQPAQSIYTTLDRKLQTMVQDIIQEAYVAGAPTWAPTAGGASVVVLDVKTGAVLAMANYPYYRPNVLNPFNSHPLTRKPISRIPDQQPRSHLEPCDTGAISGRLGSRDRLDVGWPWIVGY